MKKKLEDVRVINCFGDDYNVLTVPTSSNGNIKSPFCYSAIVEGPVGSDDPTKFVCVWMIKESVINAMRDLFVIGLKEAYGGVESISKVDEELVENALICTENEFDFCDWDEPYDLYVINDKVDSEETIECALCEKITTCTSFSPDPGNCEDFIKRIN